MMHERKDRKNIIILIAIVGLLTIVIGVILIFCSTDRKLKKQLDLGNKYLAEMNYNQAIVAFKAAIKIDSKCVEAYLGAAKAYIDLGDSENALDILKRGMELTGDEQIANLIYELEISLQTSSIPVESTLDTVDIQSNNDEIIQNFFDTYDGLFDYSELILSCINGAKWDRFLSVAEREEAFRGIAEELERYKDDLFKIEGLPDEIYKGEYIYSKYSLSDGVGTPVNYYTLTYVYHDLNELYLLLGDLNKCIEIRKEGAEKLDRYDLLEDGNWGWYKMDDRTYDRYGRVNGWLHDGEITSSIIYDEENVGPIEVNEHGQYKTKWQYRYDEEDRLVFIRLDMNGNGDYIDSTYSYEGNRTVRVKSTDDATADGFLLIYDEYGNQIN